MILYYCELCKKKISIDANYENPKEIDNKIIKHYKDIHNKEIKR
jgi:hypothetical protein